MNLLNKLKWKWKVKVYMCPLEHPKIKIKGIKKSQVSRSILSSMLLYFLGKSAFICISCFRAVEFMALNLIPEAEVKRVELMYRVDLEIED